jgi:hypothetical protein
MVYLHRLSTHPNGYAMDPSHTASHYTEEQLALFFQGYPNEVPKHTEKLDPEAKKKRRRLNKKQRAARRNNR